MSRQVIDSISRSLQQVSNMIDKQNYKKALAILEKAEQRAYDENILEFAPSILLLRGEIYEADDRMDEALDLYEESFILSSDFFLKDPDVFKEPLTSCLTYLSSILAETEDVLSAESICETNEDLFRKIHDVYNKLIADNPEDIDYLMNYSNSLGCILVVYIVAQEAESQITMVTDVMTAYADIMARVPEDSDIPLILYEMVEHYATACLTNGSIEEAKQVYENLIEIYLIILEKEPDRKDVLKLLSDSYVLIADFYSHIDEPENAQTYYVKALDTMGNPLQKDSDDLLNTISTGKIYHKMGTLFSKEGDYSKSGSYCEKSLEAIEELLEKKPEDPDILDECIILLEEIAGSFSSLELTEEAKRCYAHELDIYKSFIEAGIDITENKLCIAETFQQIAGLYTIENDTENAKRCFEKGMSIYEKLLLDDPEESGYEVAIAHVLTSLGSLYLENDETAKEYYEKALDIYKRIRTDIPEYAGFAQGYVKTMQYLAKIHNSRGQYETAISLLQQVVDFLQELEPKLPENWMLLDELGTTYRSLGDLYGSLGNAERSAEFHSNALESFSKVLFDNTCISVARKFVGIDMLFSGSYYLHKEKHEVAGPYLELCRRFYEQAREDDLSNPDNAMCLSTVLCDLGVLNYNTGSQQKAIENYSTSLSLLEDLIRTSPENLDFLDNVAFIYTRIGAAYCASDDLERSKQAFEQSEHTRTVIIAKDPDYSFDLEQEIVYLEEYAKLLTKMGMDEKAASYKEKAEEKSRTSNIES